MAFRKYSATKIELKEFQDGSDVWFNWVEKALKAKQLNETPVLEKNSEINARNAEINMLFSRQFLK